jgi:ribosomal protein S27E
MAGRHGDCTPMIAIYSKRWPVNVSVQCPHCGAILGEW